MLSLPDSWDFSIRGLACIFPDSVTKISNALKKLEQFGYLRRERVYVDGKIADWDYIISDEPMEDDVPDDSGNPTDLDTANLDAENLDTENLNQANQDFEKPYSNKINNNKEFINQKRKNPSINHPPRLTDRLTDILSVSMTTLNSSGKNRLLRLC